MSSLLVESVAGMPEDGVPDDHHEGNRVEQNELFLLHTLAE